MAMLDALLYPLLAVAACFLLGAILYCSEQVGFWAAVLWVVHSLLLLLRRLLRRIDWEKLSTLVLALSLGLVVTLTATVPVSAPAEPCDPACAEHCTIHEGETTRDLYQALQTAFSVIEGDSADFREHLTAAAKDAESKWAAWGLKAGACLLPLLIPGSAATATVTLLWSFLPHHVPILSATWYIFSGLDPYSIRMAKSIHEDLRKKKKTGVFIFLRTNRRKISEDDLAEIRRINYHLYSGDEARFLRFCPRRFRRLRFYFLSENTDENFDRMQEFLETAQTRKHLFFPLGKRREEPFQQELYLLSETESAPMLIDHLRDRLKEYPCFRNTELYLLDRFRATSYDLLLKQPLQAHIDGDKLHVLVLGFGKIGREFFRAACHLGVDRRCKPKFTLCDVKINDKIKQFRSQCPELDQSVRFRHIKLDAETAALDALLKSQDYHYILVALGDDERNIRVASRLKRFYRLRHWDDVAQRRTGNPQPQICVNLEDSIKHSYTKELWTKTFEEDRALRVFGGLDQVFTEEVLVPRNLHRAARWIHRELNRSRITGEVQEKAHWGEYERRSSIACALHAKFHATSFGENYSALLRQYKSDDYSKLIDMEHDRWMAYVRSEGLRKSDPDLMEAYYNTKNGRHVDILGKLTPCLAEPDELATLWNRLLAKDHAYYSGQYTFRERDELVVLNAKIIAQGIDTGEFPERSIPKITT